MAHGVLLGYLPERDLDGKPLLVTDQTVADTDTGFSVDKAIENNTKYMLLTEQAQPYHLWKTDIRRIGDRCGVGIQIFFYTAKTYGYLFVLFFVLAIYALVTDARGDNLGSGDNSLTNQSLGEISSATQLCWQAFLEFVISLFGLLFISYLHADNRALGQSWDAFNMTADDYAIMINGLPKDTTYLQVQKYVYGIMGLLEASRFPELQNLAAVGDPDVLADTPIVLTDVDELLSAWRRRKFLSDSVRQLEKFVAEGPRTVALHEQADEHKRFEKAKQLLLEYAKELEEVEKDYQNKSNLALEKECTGSAIVTFKNPEISKAVVDKYKYRDFFKRNVCTVSHLRDAMTPPPFNPNSNNPTFEITIQRAPNPSSIHYENFSLNHLKRFQHLIISLVATLVLIGISCTFIVLTERAKNSNVENKSTSYRTGISILTAFLTTCLLYTSPSPRDS
eukprot:TRINITY_DN2487_c0_g1_i8.p1 TRINITY_DN2487_c0_g1~~TRINITY_DN2487_c0_g1_i8.p1  ORF type:complete len:450 (-),score=132.10 TRINITY_DN2487_c0_g1_i8:139-1488(-)